MQLDKDNLETLKSPHFYQPSLAFHAAQIETEHSEANKSDKQTAKENVNQS